MARVIWFAIGLYAGLEGLTFVPKSTGYNIFISFVMNPGSFLATAVFMIFSFLVLSVALKQFFRVLIENIKTKRGRTIFYLIEFIVYIMGWVYLFKRNVWFSMILLTLTLIYLLLSIGRKQEPQDMGL